MLCIFSVLILRARSDLSPYGADCTPAATPLSPLAHGGLAHSCEDDVERARRQRILRDLISFERETGSKTRVRNQAIVAAPVYQFHWDWQQNEDGDPTISELMDHPAVPNAHRLSVRFNIRAARASSGQMSMNVYNIWHGQRVIYPGAGTAEERDADSPRAARWEDIIDLNCISAVTSSYLLSSAWDGFLLSTRWRARDHGEPEPSFLVSLVNVGVTPRASMLAASAGAQDFLALVSLGSFGRFAYYALVDARRLRLGTIEWSQGLLIALSATRTRDRMDGSAGYDMEGRSSGLMPSLSSRVEPIVYFPRSIHLFPEKASPWLVRSRGHVGVEVKVSASLNPYKVAKVSGPPGRVRSVNAETVAVQSTSTSRMRQRAGSRQQTDSREQVGMRQQADQTRLLPVRQEAAGSGASPTGPIREPETMSSRASGARWSLRVLLLVPSRTIRDTEMVESPTFTSEELGLRRDWSWSRLISVFKEKIDDLGDDLRVAGDPPRADVRAQTGGVIIRKLGYPGVTLRIMLPMGHSKRLILVTLSKSVSPLSWAILEQEASSPARQTSAWAETARASAEAARASTEGTRESVGLAGAQAGSSSQAGSSGTQGLSGAPFRRSVGSTWFWNRGWLVIVEESTNTGTVPNRQVSGESADAE